MYRFAALAITALIVLSACGNSSVAEPETGGDGSDITIDSFEFTPNNLVVKVGDTITWTNEQDIAHTTSSGIEGGWSSELLQPGDSFSFTFTEAGQFPYQCTIHPTMIGVIDVAA